MDHRESEKVAESLKLSKAEKVHGYTFGGVQCTWKSVNDRDRRRRSVVVVGHVRDYMGKKGETTANLTHGDTG